MQVAIPSRGELSELPLPALLLALHEGRQSCVLTVQRGQVRKEIFLREGEVVRVSSTNPGESLSKFLGLGAAAQEVVFRHLQDHPNTFLEAIVARGLADRAEIERRLEEAARQRLSECLSWDRGSYEVAALDPAVAARPPSKRVLPVAEAIFSGLRGSLDPVQSAALLRPLLRAKLAPDARAQRYKPAFLSVFGDSGLFDRLRDGVTGEALCEGSGDPNRILAELQALLRSGLLTAELPRGGGEVRGSARETVRRYPGDPSGAARRPGAPLRELQALAEASAAAPEEEEKRSILLARLRDAAPWDAAEVAERVGAAWAASQAAPAVAALHYEVGRAYEEQAARLDLAAERYRAALRVDLAHADSQDALGAILRAAGDDDSYEQLLAQSAQAEPDPKRRARLHRSRAELLAERKNDLGGAERELRAALALLPFEVDILEDMVSLLERQGKAPKLVASYLERLARVCLSSREAPDTDRGLAYLRRALELDPDNRDSWGLAERVLRAAGRWAELEELYRSSLNRADEAGREAMLRKLAGLEIFGRQGVARWACEELLKLDPANTFARQRLRDLYEEASDHLARARLREEDIHRAQNLRGKNAARLELAELHLRRFADADRASALIGEVLSDDPYHAAAYDLAHLYLAREGNYPAYAEVLARAVESPNWRELKAELQSPERVARAAELAWVLESQVRDLTRALSAWNRVLALASNHAEARAAVARLEHALAAANKELSELAQAVRSLKKMSEKLEALRRLGRAARNRDLDRAVQAYEELLEVKNSDEEALSALESIYTARRDFGSLVSTLRRRIASAATDDVRAGLLNRIAALSHERLGAPDQALRICREVLRVDAQNATALGRMERIYTQLGNTEGLLGVYAHRAQVSERGPERASLYRQMAKLAATDSARSATFWEQVLKESPGDREALFALEELYEALGRGQDLARVLSERVARTPAGDPTLPQALKRLARLYESGAQDPVRALEAWERLLSLNPEDSDALAALAAAREAAGDTKAWAEMALRLLPRMKDPARASALAVRLAPVLATELNRAPEADQMLSAHLGRIGLRGGDHARYLAKLREQRNDRRGAVSALELELIAEDAPPRKAALSQRIAAMWREGATELPLAVEAYRRVVTLDPRSEAGWGALCSLYDTMGRNDDLIAAKEVLVTLASDSAVKSKQLHEISQLHETRRRDTDAALHALRRACQIDILDANSLRSFQEATARLGRFEPFSEHLDSLGLPPRERVRRMGEIARRCRELTPGDLGRAISCWQVTYERYPEEPESFAGLAALVEESGRYEALVEAYESRLGQVDPLERSRLLQKIGEICEQKLADPDRAVASFRRGFEAAPDDPQAVSGYAKALEERGRWEEYIRLYERVALEAIDPAARGAALERVAQVTRQHLNDLSRTFEVKRRAFDLDAAEPTKLRELETLAEESGQWSGLAEVYQALAERAKSEGSKIGRLNALAALLEERLHNPQAAYQRRMEAWRVDPRDGALKSQALRLAERAGDFGPVIEFLLSWSSQLSSDERVDALSEAARLEEHRRHDPERAFTLYLEALPLDPRREPVVQELWRLAGADTEVSAGADFTGPRRWGKVLGVYEQLLSQATEPKERVGYFHKISSIFEVPLGDEARALEVLELALHVDKKDAKTLDEMERLGRRPALTPRLLKRFDEEVERAQEARDAIPYLERMARILDEASNEPLRAAEILRRILAMQPSHDGARGKLREVLRRLGRFDELIALLESEVADAPASVARRERLREIAGLYEEILKNPREAQALYAKVLAEEPGDYDALKNLARLHESFGEWRKLAEAEGRLAQLEKEPRAAAARLRRMAELYEQQIALPRRAVEAYREVLRVLPDDGPALSELARLLEAQRRWDELVDILAKAAERGGSEALPTLVRRAQILAERLGRPAEAIQVLRQVLGQEPRNLEARRGLVQALRLERRFAEIAETVSRWEQEGHVEAGLLIRLGEAYTEAKDDGRAEAAYGRALAAEPSHEEALHGLAEISRRRGDATRAAELLSREAELLLARAKEVAPAHQSELRTRAAALFEDAAELSHTRAEVEATRQGLRSALKADPRRAGAARRLLNLAQSPDDFGALRDSLQALLEKSEGRDRAQLYADLGMVEWRGYGRASAAFEAFESALTAFPGLPAAAAGLAEVHRERGTWTEDATTRKLYFTLQEAIEKGVGRRDASAGRLYYHFGHVKARMNELEDALTQLRRARERLGGDADITLALAELSSNAGRPEDAIRYYQLYAAHPDATERPERLAEAQLTLGLLLRRSDPAAALTALISASSHAKVSERALPLAAELAELQGDWIRAEVLLLRQAELTQAPAGRRELFARRAEALIALGDREAAVASLRRAIQEPVGVPPFSLYARVLDLLGGLSRWDEALSLAQEISSLGQATSPDDATVLNLRAAEVFARTGQNDRASKHIEAALAADPNSAAAFEALARYHQSRNDAQALAATYQRRLESLPAGDAQERPRVLASLSAVLLGELRDAEGALSAAREAAKLAPDDADVLEGYAKAAEALPAPTQERVTVLTRLLQHRPGRADLLRQLGRAHEQAGDEARSYWTRSILVAVGKADAREREYAEQRRYVAPRPPGGAALTLPPALVAPAARALGGVFSTVYGAAADLFQPVTPRGAALPVLHGAPAPRLLADLGRLFPSLRAKAYVADGDAVRPLRAIAPAIEVGSSAPRDLAQLRFALARASVAASPAFVLFTTGDRAEAQLSFAAVLYAFDPSKRLADAPAEQRALVGQLRERLSTRQRIALVRQITALGKELPSFDAFYAAVEETLNRVGFFYAGDVAAAVKSIGGVNGDAELDARLKARPVLGDLIRFLTSDEHLELRAQLRLPGLRAQL